MKYFLVLLATAVMFVFAFITGSHLGVFVSDLGISLLGTSHAARIVSLLVAFGVCYGYGSLLGRLILSPIIRRLLK